MSRYGFTLSLGVATVLFSSVAFAGGALPPSTDPIVTTTGSGTDTMNRGYAGLKWTLGDGVVPAVVIGFRHARVESNGDTQGGDVSFSVGLAGGLQPGKLRAKYFNGQENIQGEVGAGYDFTKGLFAGVGVQGPYVNLGVDYLFSAVSPVEPFLMLNTLKRFDKPNESTALSCPDGYTLNGNSCDLELD